MAAGGAPRVLAALDALAAEWGLEGRRAEAVAAALAHGGWRRIADLVAETATSREAVLAVVRRLEPDLERDGHAVRLRPEAAALVAARAAGAPPSDLARWVAAPGAGAPPSDLAARLASFQAGLPAPVRALDHVLATPATVAARARYLAGRFRLDGAHVLCVGDRDLTSLALALATPEARVSVVDVDDAILAHVAACAADSGVEVATSFADLRLGLPESLAGACDLAFTDPPYTPAGVALFLARSLEALAPRSDGRVVLCHGHGEAHPELGYKVQEVVHELRLLQEAVLPAFNRYVGAEAIGSQSALHLLRPTRRTWPALRRRTLRDPRIYTHGPAARESASAILPFAPEGTPVGEGWPAELGPAVPLARWLADPGAIARPALVALHPHFDALLPRVVLAGAPDGAPRPGGPADPASGAPALSVAVGPAALSALRGALAEAVDALWVTHTREREGVALLELEPREPAPPLAALLRFLAGRPRAKVANAWREGLIALAGGPLTKNEARERIAQVAPPAAALDARLPELPLHVLEALVPALARSL